MKLEVEQCVTSFK